MASFVYTTAKKKAGDGTLDWDAADVAALATPSAGATAAAGPFRIALLEATAAAAQNADHATVGAVLDGTNNIEMVTTAYSRKQLPAAGRAITEKATTAGDTASTVFLDAADVTWTGIGDSTKSAVAALVFKQATAGEDLNTADIPLFFVDLTDTVLNGGDFTIAWSADGIVTLS